MRSERVQASALCLSIGRAITKTRLFAGVRAWRRWRPLTDWWRPLLDPERGRGGVLGNGGFDPAAGCATLAVVTQPSGQRRSDSTRRFAHDQALARHPKGFWARLGDEVERGSTVAPRTQGVALGYLILPLWGIRRGVAVCAPSAVVSVRTRDNVVTAMRPCEALAETLTEALLCIALARVFYRKAS